MTRSRELREKRVKIHADAQEILQKGTITAEDKRKFDMMMTELDELKREIDREEAQEEWNKADADLRQTRRPPESQIGDAALDSARERREKRAFSNYLRFGLQGISDEDRTVLRRAEMRDMGVGTGTLGGYFVPQGFVYDIDVAMKYYGNMLGVSKILDTSTGSPLPYPTSNDTTVTGELVGEGQQVSNADVNIGHVLFGAFKFSTKMVKVSLELMQDSAFDLDGFLKEQFAIRLGRILNTKFTLGAGTTEPTGLITTLVAAGAIGVGGSSGIAVIGDDNQTTPDPTKQIGYADLTNLEHSVDKAYRPGAQWMMNDLTLKFIKMLRDKYGRPLWVPGVASNAPDTILGYSYSVNNDMATLATGNITLCFGQLKKYLIRRVKDLAVLRLVERFADYGQIAFIGFARYDGNLLDAGTHPVKFLQQS